MPDPEFKSPQSSSALKQAWKPYRQLWKRLEAPAKTILLREGDISRRIFVIEEGCIRAFFTHQGRDISFRFFFEGDIVSSTESLRKNKASDFGFETIEAVKLRWISQEDMELIRKDQQLYNQVIDNFAERQDILLKSLFSYLKDTPAQRYAQLLKENPEIIQRVPLQYIASYLGITQVSLSRIRHKIKI